jgi:hypothetical protein
MISFYPLGNAGYMKIVLTACDHFCYVQEAYWTAVIADIK